MLIVQTDLVFANVPDPKNSPVPKLNRRDIGKSACPPSPSKTRKIAEPVSFSDGQPSDSQQTSAKVTKLSDLPDSDGRYGTLPADCYKETTVAVPDIRDGNGLLIYPQDYMEKLPHGCKVAVEVLVKLWNIRAHDKSKASVPSRWYTDSEDKGSRTYQLIVKKMQILPIADITKNTFVSAITHGHGKRKTTEPDSPSKKAHRDRDDYDDCM